MPIHFTCPHCGAQTDVSDDYAGQTGPCAQCGQTITIPVPGIPPAGAAAARRSQGPPALLILLAVVLVAVLVCGGILTALLLPAIQAAREAARRAQCLNNLKQINLAMLNYEAANGCFPPAYIADENGKPMHSWRVLLLPYLEQQWLYDQYNLEEPWDSPNNRALADLMPPVYRCPSDAGGAPSETSYVVIVGPGTVFDGDKSIKSDEIQDGTSNTLMVVEMAGSGIDWMEPRDLDAKQMSYQINPPGGNGIKSDHSGGASVSMCDGSVHHFDNSKSPQEVQGMSTVAGGEPVSPW